MRRIACFITPHGFGHAARAAAVMEAVGDAVPLVSFDIFTTIPEWFFADSLSNPYEYHELVTDIGLVQKTPFFHDLEKTIEALDRFIPFDTKTIKDTADVLRQKKCQLVICDISPIGIAIAKKAKIPSLLVENFTWDWIYEDFMSDARMRRYVDFFREIFRSADYHIQTAPVCNLKAVDMITHPVSRKIRLPSVRVREKLGISQEKRVVLVTTGGIREKYRFLEKFTTKQEICFVIPGGSESFERQDNLILLPFRSGFNHSDLVNAVDVVVGKAGYSTIAEVYHAGVSFGYVMRSNFRETGKLVAFIKKEMKGLCINEEKFKTGKWVENVSQLLSIPRIHRHHRNGSQQTADMIKNILKREQN